MALKVNEVAQDLGVTADMVYREIRAGNLKAFRVGSRTIRIRPEDLQDYKDKQMVTVEMMEEL